MATPTKTDLQTLDYSYFGQPYVQVAAKPGIDLDTLDYSYFGVPFVGTSVGLFIFTPTPACRMLLIKAENRIMDIAKEDRFIEIPKCHDGGGV